MDDLISRKVAIKACNQQTTDCNPDHFNGHEHFTEFLDDATIGSFGKWQFANGFNVGVMAARVAIKNIDPAQRWIPVTERLPGEFVSVQAHMTDAGPFPSVREAYLAGGEWFFPALNEYHPVDKWAEFLEPPEKECYVQEIA